MTDEILSQAALASIRAGIPTPPIPTRAERQRAVDAATRPERIASIADRLAIVRRELDAKLHAEDERMRRILPPAPAGLKWQGEISASTEYVEPFTAHATIRLRYRLVEIDECARCEGDRWVDDPSACDDPDHCSPIVPCPACNPDGSRE